MFDRVRRALASPRLLEFTRFFGASAAGLAVDLAGFQLLSASGLAVWLSNAISSTVSISLVYLLSARFSFGARPTIGTYVAFVGWYASSILVFSTLIHVATTTSGTAPLVWKAVSIPISFLLNYAFNRLLFRRPRPLDQES
jgi:putative flippase GtrA